MTGIQAQPPSMSRTSRALVFADQSVEIQPSLQRLWWFARESAILEAFLRRAAREICDRAGCTPEARGLFPTDESLLDLCRDYKETNVDIIVRTVLLSLNQLGWLLVEACLDGSLLRPQGKKVLFASCTGSFAAVAAASAQSVGSLMDISVEIMKVALSVGVEIRRRSDAVDASPGSWTIALSNSDRSAKEIVEQFNHSSGLPPHRQAYVSAVSPTTMSISGPPSTLKLFRVCSLLPLEQRVTELPISAGFHAPHLRKADVASILNNATFASGPIDEVEYIMASGELFPQSSLNAEALMRSVLVEIFQEPQDLVAMTERLGLCAKAGELEVSFVGPQFGKILIESSLKPFRAHALAVDGMVSSMPDHPGNEEEEIAIIGMSGRFPGADDVDSLWEVLMEGRDMCQEVPRSRFDLDTHYDPTGQAPNTTSVPYGCFLDNADLFDNLLFHMSPRQAANTDPVQRMLLLTAYEALEQAGYSYEGRDAISIGSFFGCTSDDYREVNAGQNIDMFHIPGGIRAFATGKLNYHFGWEGPAYTVDTACSSSAAAIELACSALIGKKCRAAIAGGGGILTCSDMYAGLSRAGVISPSGPCKTWDAMADGYCRAEAVGVVLLKRLADAIQDRDNVLAVIKSASTKHSPQASSITHPHAEQQARLAQAVLNTSNLPPSEVDYVEMHGTGTQAGDVAEASSITELFRGVRSKDRPLHIGTVKPNIGHSEAGSGVSSVIKAALMFKYSRMPPHVGIKTTRNPNMPHLEGSHIHIPLEATPFHAHPNSDGKRRILVNNFNITSGSTTLLMEDGIVPPVNGSDPRSCHVVAVSGHCETSLEANLRRLHAHIVQNPHINLADLAYTTTARRIHHAYRRGFAVRSLDEFADQIENEPGLSAPRVRSRPHLSMVFVFTGQASRFVGVGQKLFAESSVFRESLISSDAICQDLQQPSFIDILRQPELDLETVEPTSLHLALAALQIALAKLWRSWGVEPSAVVGHSLGEYAALCVAGVLSATDMFYLIGQRGRLLEQHCTKGAYGMLAIQAELEFVRNFLSEVDASDCDVACHNGPSAQVVSGPVASIESLEKQVKQHGIPAKRLEVPYAFHSRHMDDIVSKMKTLAAGVVFDRPRIPVASTVAGTVVDDVFDASYIASHVRQPVQFLEAISDLSKRGLATEQTLWLEIGPSQVCLNMVRGVVDVEPSRLLPSFTSDDAWTSLGSSLAKAYTAGVNVTWAPYHQEYVSALRVIDLPSYAFDLKSYWIQYEGDWIVRKNRGSAKPTLPAPKLTLLPEVESESFTADSASATFLADLQEPNLRNIVTGHRINDNGLCPGSAYGDMAMGVASYIWRRQHPNGAVPSFEVASMDITKPLILLRNATSQPLRITARKHSGSDEVHMTMHALHDDEEVQHLTCVIRPGDGAAWTSEWSKDAYLRRARISSLQSESQTGAVHHLRHGMIYKLFSNLVNYGIAYRGMQDVYLDSAAWEAAARIVLPATPDGANFTCSPYWIETLAHLSGFILNGSDTTPEDTFYFAHGWESVRIAQPLAAGSTYWAHVRMQDVGPRGIHTREIQGDVYVFPDGSDTVVAVIRGIRFHAIQRRLMDALLPKARPTGLPTAGAESISTAASMPQHEHGTHLAFPSTAPSTVQSRAQSRPVSTLSSPPSSLADDHQEAFKTPTATATAVSSQPSSTDDTAEEARITHTIKSVVAQELNMPIAQLPSSAPLADLGIDSLMLLAMQTRLRDATGKHVPASCFARPNSLDEVVGWVVKRS